MSGQRAPTGPARAGRRQARDADRRRPPVVLITNIDTIKAKNLYQLRGLGEQGYRFIILTTDSLGDSRDVLAGADNVELVVCDRKRVRWSMLALLTRLLLTRQIDIAELYPSSYLSLAQLVLIKMRGVPVVLIARGEEFYYVSGMMSRARALAFRWTYALADYVLYKELYMEDMLRRLGKAHMSHLITNAVELPDRMHRHRPGCCRFLYMNSFKEFRHPDIAVRAFLGLWEELKDRPGLELRLDVVGMLGETASPAIVEKEARLKEMIAGRDAPVYLHPWSLDSAAWLDDADVFLLPADVVFLNYSLLEAMSRTVPVIVQAAEGADLIVTEGVDGFLLPPDAPEWQARMRVLAENADLRAEMGAAARRKVAERFGLEAYLQTYSDAYGRIMRRQTGRK